MPKNISDEERYWEAVNDICDTKRTGVEAAYWAIKCSRDLISMLRKYSEISHAKMNLLSLRVKEAERCLWDSRLTCPGGKLPVPKTGRMIWERAALDAISVAVRMPVSPWFEQLDFTSETVWFFVKEYTRAGALLSTDPTSRSYQKPAPADYWEHAADAAERLLLMISAVRKKRK